MEKIDPGMNTINIGPTLYDSTATSNNGVPDIKTIHHTYVSPLHALNLLRVAVYTFAEPMRFCNNDIANK